MIRGPSPAARPTPPKVPRPYPAPVATSRVIAALASDLAAGDARAVLDRFWGTTAGRTPIVEPVDDADDEAIVTFVWRDADAAQVLLFANRLTDEKRLDESRMRRLPGTDVWHLSYRMRADWRASYVFLPQAPDERPAWLADDDQIAIRAALDRGRLDPNNPDVCSNRSGIPQSVVSLPDAPPQPWLRERGPTVRRGELATEHTPGGRTVWVHRSAGPAPTTCTPLLVVFDGDVWTTTQSLPTTLDNLYHDGEIPTLHTLLVDAGDRARRWEEHTAGTIDRYVLEELLPWARARLPVLGGASSVVVVGQSLGGLSALRLAVRHPGKIGGALVQSASLWHDDLRTSLARAHLPTTRIQLQVGANEWVLVDDHRRAAERLVAVGAEVEHVVYNGGHDDAWWRGAIADGLRWLLGPTRGQSAQATVLTSSDSATARGVSSPS